VTGARGYAPGSSTVRAPTVRSIAAISSSEL
jgi:hypothetical protein